MASQVQTLCFRGLKAFSVDVQVKILPGLPSMTLVGLPDKAVNESKERVRQALTSLGLAFPSKKIVINLAPGDLPKEGNHYDLPIALALMEHLEAIPKDFLQDFFVLGELGLDGKIFPVKSVLPCAIRAYQLGKGLVCPWGNGSEAAWTGSAKILAPGHLVELVSHMQGHSLLPPPKKEKPNNSRASVPLTFQDIKGQETPKRALLIAAAGRHHMLMSGPPGAGKSLLASSLPYLLPPLTPEESLEVTMIHSLGHQENQGLIQFPPFRDPHHSSSMVALLGGGNQMRPGELSLAHRGVLFLDELPEFPRSTLEALRQPLENGYISLSRAQYKAILPCKTLLVGAMNPCPCGFLGDPRKSCSKAPVCGEVYQKKLSGPLLERFDLFVQVQPVGAQYLKGLSQGSEAGDRGPGAQASIIQSISRVHQIKQERKQYQLENPKKNMDIEDFPLSQEGKALMEKALDRWQLSARSFFRTLEVAQTICDLDQAGSSIQAMHIAEALSYRQPLFTRKF